MLPTTNRTISILRLTTTGEKKAFVSVATGVRVYINQSSEDLIDGSDNQGAFFVHKMLTDGTHATITMNDRITDDLGNQFDVRGKSTFSDMTGQHHQYVLLQTFK